MGMRNHYAFMSPKIWQFKREIVKADFFLHWRHSLIYCPLTWTLWYRTYIDIVPSACGTCRLSFENEISFCTGWIFGKHNSCLLSSCGFLLVHFFCGTFSNLKKSRISNHIQLQVFKKPVLAFHIQLPV